LNEFENKLIPIAAGSVLAAVASSSVAQAAETAWLKQNCLRETQGDSLGYACPQEIVNTNNV